MNHKTRKNQTFITQSILFLLGMSALTVRVDARPRRTSPQEKIAITRATQAFIDKNSNHVGKVTVKGFDIQGIWAKTVAVPAKPDVDSVYVILKKRNHVWKVITLGTNLVGVGAQYGVPKYLWKKWGI